MLPACTGESCALFMLGFFRLTKILIIYKTISFYKFIPNLPPPFFRGYFFLKILINTSSWHGELHVSE